MPRKTYLMENPEENLRLERKTKEGDVIAQAHWAGVESGMRVLDAGCGPGITSSILNKQVQPEGEIVGVDYSEQRINYAKHKYAKGKSLTFNLHDLRDAITDIKPFDLIWIRFVLEYNKNESTTIIKNMDSILKPGGWMCLIDLDYNCLTHYNIPHELQAGFLNMANLLERKYNFDPYMGRKLYSYLYDLGYENIQVDVRAHHLFYGVLDQRDVFNWQKKLDLAKAVGGRLFKGFPGGGEGFVESFMRFFLNPRRFTYTPLILCKGRKPA